METLAWGATLVVLLSYTLIQYARTRQASFLAWSVGNALLLLWMFDGRNIESGAAFICIALTIVLQVRRARRLRANPLAEIIARAERDARRSVR